MPKGMCKLNIYNAIVVHVLRFSHGISSESAENPWPGSLVIPFLMQQHREEDSQLGLGLNSEGRSRILGYGIMSLK
uniref:Uncharacterized protein n=1 Tax=Rhizophora mucronata TaxID=61149 RepID=A0A2P2JG06_RHIMU